MHLERLTWLTLLLAAFTGPLWVDPLATEPLGPVKTLSSILLPLCALGLALVRAGWTIFSSPFSKAIAALLAVATITALRSPCWPLASEELLRIFGLTATAWAAATCSWTPRRVTLLAGSLVAGALINGTLALAEHYAWPWQFYGQQDRLVALFGHQNVLAQFLVIPTMMMVTWPSRGWLTGAISFFLMGLLGITLCRGSWAAVAAATGLMFLTRLRTSQPGMAGLLLTLGVLCGMTLNGLLAPDARSPEAPFTYKRDIRILSGDSNRLTYYRQGMDLLIERPLLGWGLGQFPSVYQKIDTSRHEFVRYAHCDYLQWGIETGLAGLATLGAVGFILVRKFLSAPVHLIPLAAGLAGTLAHSVVEYTMYMSVTSMLAALCAGALASGTPMTSLAARSGWGPKAAWVAVGVAMVGLLAPVIVAPMKASRLERASIAAMLDASQGESARTQLSLKLLDEALSLTPHDPALLWNTAYAQTQVGRDQQAVETLERLRTLTPHNERVHLLLADTHERMGNTQALAVSLERAREVLPCSRSLLLALAILHTREGHPLEREAALDSLRSLPSWQEDEREFLTRLDRSSNPKSLEHIREYLEGLRNKGGSSDRVTLRLASVSFRLKKQEQAITLYRELMRTGISGNGLASLLPDEKESLFVAAGNVARHQGLEEEATGYYESGFHLHPYSLQLFTLVFQGKLNAEGWLEARSFLESTLANGFAELPARRSAAQVLGNWQGGTQAKLEGLRQLEKVASLETTGENYYLCGIYAEQKLENASTAYMYFVQAMNLDGSNSMKEKCMEGIKTLNLTNVEMGD